jgi:CheY-like chemotaxis protein
VEVEVSGNYVTICAGSYRRVTVKRRILVVDDDDAARHAVALSLRTVAGWDVVEAYCGAQAIERATQQQPDAILLDVMMPAMDGPAMLAKLRAARATSHIPIVLLTAKVQAVQNGSLSHLPVAGILLKPFDPLRLAGQVADALGWEPPKS